MHLCLAGKHAYVIGAALVFLAGMPGRIASHFQSESVLSEKKRNTGSFYLKKTNRGYVNKR